MKKSVSNKVVIWLFVVSILVLLVLLCSFLLFFNKESNKHDIVVDNGKLLMSYSSANNSLTIDDSFQLSDEDAIKLDGDSYYFDFSVSADLKDSSKMEYEIVVTKDVKNSTIPDEDVLIYLEKVESGSYVDVFKPKKYKTLTNKSELGAPVGSMILSKVTLKKDSSDNYRLRMWISDKAVLDTTQLNAYSVKIDIYGKSF